MITDLDGTLLDAERYCWNAANPALEKIKASHTPLIFCTSKTGAETKYWRKKLRNTHPFIVENGGALYIPVGYFPFPVPHARPAGAYERVQFGECYGAVVEALRDAAAEADCRVEGFSQWTTAEVAERCGMNLEQAGLAKQREFDEPFEIMEGSAEELQRALEGRGKRMTRGGRFYHASSHHDKALAVQTLLRLYDRAHGRVWSIGFGDSPCDEDFLRAVHRPVILRSRFSGWLANAVPGAKVTQGPGPAGWNQAVLEMIP